MPCMGSSFLPFMLGFTLLISDAPFRTRQQRFIIQRTGKRAWILGQLAAYGEADGYVRETKKAACTW